MSLYPSIPLTVESKAPCEVRTENTLPLINEIRHALGLLHTSAQSTCIDLHALPMTKAEIEELESLLGTGEVRVMISSLGQSCIQETSYPGVWLTKHLDENGLVQSHFIDIAPIPEIIPAKPQEIAESGSRLTELLENLTNE